MHQPTVGPRRWLRFSLATFLFVSLCIGGLIAGYQSGYDTGSSEARRGLILQSMLTMGVQGAEISGNGLVIVRSSSPHLERCYERWLRAEGDVE